MNASNAAQYLPLVQALADGKAIQVVFTDDIWNDFTDFNFCAPPERYRVKPEPIKKWYRVAMKEDGVMIAGCEDNHSEEDVAKKDYFIRWLTDRVEYVVENA